METKSRYEVISDLENKKRELIKERDGLFDLLITRERNLKNIERQKLDHMIQLDRQIEDVKEDIENFRKTLEERKSTITELIKSVDDSLERFGKISKEK